MPEVKLTRIERGAIREVNGYIKARGLSLTEVAKRAGLPLPTVSRVLGGKQRASFDIWEKLYDVTLKGKP